MLQIIIQGVLLYRLFGIAAFAAMGLVVLVTVFTGKITAIRSVQNIKYFKLASERLGFLREVLIGNSFLF